MDINKDALKKYFRSKNIKSRIAGNSIKMKENFQIICPKCGKPKLFINFNNGLWTCHTCPDKGNIFSFFKLFGDEYRKVVNKKTKNILGKSYKIPDQSLNDMYEEQLAHDAEAKTYLTRVRCYTKEACKHFRLGISFRTDAKTSEEQKTLVFPHIEGKTIVNYKYKIMPPNKKGFFKVAGTKPIIYNLSFCDKNEPLILVEGEADVIAMWDYGFKNVAGSTQGGDNFEKEWVEDLKDFKEILIGYENDQVGNSGAEKISGLLGKHRCKRIKFPLHDANECLASGIKKEIIEKCVKEAEGFKINEIKHIKDFKDDCFEDYNTKEGKNGYKTGFYALDDILGGLRGGEITVVIGGTSCGKTTFTTNLIKNLVNDKVPCCIASFEMRIVKINRKIVSMYSGVRYQDIPKDQFEKTMDEISSKELYFIDVFGCMTTWKLRQTIEFAIHRYGIKVFVLDNLQFFVDRKTKDMTSAIGQAMMDLKTIANDFNVHILLVVHPYKTSDDSPIKKHEAKGSSSIYQDADNFISIFIDRNRRHMVTFYVMKNREFGNEDDFLLYYDNESQNYYNDEESLRRK